MSKTIDSNLKLSKTSVFSIALSAPLSSNLLFKIDWCYSCPPKGFPKHSRKDHFGNNHRERLKRRDKDSQVSTTLLRNQAHSWALLCLIECSCCWFHSKKCACVLFKSQMVSKANQVKKEDGIAKVKQTHPPPACSWTSAPARYLNHL